MGTWTDHTATLDTPRHDQALVEDPLPDDLRSDSVGEPVAELPVQLAVRRAVSVMRDRYYEPITLTGLASEVFVSPFHFSRVFTKAVGVTPGRFLTALRLFEAKMLLVRTSMTVSDVVCQVGYSSVGTFTTRFTRAVGMTPTQYRDPQVADLLVAVASHFQRMPSLGLLHAYGLSNLPCRQGDGVITGRIEMPAGCAPADVLVGVFSEAVPQRGPVAFVGMPHVRSSQFTVTGVPQGRWHVIAVAEHAPGTPAAAFSTGGVQCTAGVGQVDPADVRIRMRAPRPTDPPIAITLASRTDLAAAQRMATDLRVA